MTSQSTYYLLLNSQACLVGFGIGVCVFGFFFLNRVLFTLKSQTIITGLVLYLWYPLSILVLLASCIWGLCLEQALRKDLCS